MRILRNVWAALLVSMVPLFAAPYDGWQHAGALHVLTTPEGANLPATSSVKDFPLLVRLHRDWFDFTQARPNGEDIRFSSSAGVALAYQVEEWDAVKGEASLWVRVPVIRGNERQELRVHWGNAGAASESSGRAVFNLANDYLSVWHMGGSVADEVGTLESKDTGTTATNGIIGRARHFPGKAGVFGGDKISNYPVGASPHSSEVWFRTRTPNSTLVSWGNEQAQGKVVMQLRSPPYIRMDCYFSGGDVASASRLRLGEWTHVVHTYRQGESVIYVNGQPDGTNSSKGSPLAIKSPARLWLGGWYNNYSFVGDLDEVRVSKVARPADWVRLQYENQKRQQTLVGPLVRAGNAFAVSPEQASVAEGESVVFTAQAGGAQKVYWLLVRDGREEIVATDRFNFTFDAGRVTGDTPATLRFKAVCASEVKTRDIAIIINERIPEPQVRVMAPAKWNGRDAIDVQVSTWFGRMAPADLPPTKVSWKIAGGAVVKEVDGKTLRLKRAQFTGKLSITATVSNGGGEAEDTVTIMVTEPERDAWEARTPAKDEMPEDGQFYARDDRNEGTLHCNGRLTEAADAVFLRLYADDKLIETETTKPRADHSYALAAKLKPGLIKYRVEFGTKVGALETVRHTATNIVCGDAFLIGGQSNALATDTGDKSPAETSEWIRSYGRPPGSAKSAPGNLWCHPVWKAQNGEKAELGWWGMELAKRLVESQKVPIFIINAAVGGTRIDQHQRNMENPTDLSTIYGRMLWRVQQAKLTHGIRGILWHQGENDQGADGPTGGFGWETYHQYFIEMSAGWKRDFPNVQHYYVFQIWPNSCAMGGREGSGDMLREKQRTLPQLYSNMSILSTLGVRPPGGCHFPLVGWAEFARMIQPVIERDHYGKTPTAPVTAPNLRHATFVGSARDTIAFEFDQPVVWTDALAGQFYLDGEKDKVASGSVAGNVLTLKLKAPSAATKVTYLKEIAWSQDKLLNGANGIAALTFCNVPIHELALSH